MTDTLHPEAKNTRERVEKKGRSYIKKYLKFVVEYSHKFNIYFPKYNFMTDNLRPYVFGMFEDLEKKGMTRDDIFQILNDTGLAKSDLEKKLNGDKAIFLWEYEMWCRKLGFTMPKPVLPKPMYEFSVEGSGDRKRIIMVRNYIPKCHISMDMYDPKNIEIDFTNHGSVLHMGEMRIKKVCMEMINTYFENGLPINEKTMKQHIRKKYLIGEVIGIDPDKTIRQ